MKNNDAITFRGEKLAIAGAAVKEGSKLPAFQLINTEMKEITDQTYAGKTLIVCVVPSVDTPVCSVELKRFNTDAASLGETVVLAVSRDLPFAQKRWCHESDAGRLELASDFKYRSFGKAFGVDATDLGLLVRAIFVAGKDGIVRHVEYVRDISEEPNYDAALAAAKSA